MVAGLQALREQRCRNHGDREASARCPSCGGFFCRECVTEHDGRILCATCLDRTTRPDAPPARSLRPGPWLAGIGGVAALWLAIHLAGRLLLTIPAEVHEGTIWEDASSWWSSE